jgi:hypothetical protein
MTWPSPEVEETGAVAYGERPVTGSGREELKAVQERKIGGDRVDDVFGACPFFS